MSVSLPSSHDRGFGAADNLLARLRGRATPQNGARVRCSEAELARRMFGAAGLVTLGGVHYRVLSRLGAGGMGVVYEVEQEGRPGHMALKLLERVGPDALFSLKREFRVRAGLAHPNLVTLFELVSDDDSAAFTMELVPGVDFLRHVRPAGRLDLARLEGALRGISEGLATLHAEGIVHRDLKPSNVLATDAGRVVLLDFGIALSGDEQDVGGTPAFMPEEQRAGRTVPASDVYALGVMLSLALEGERAPEALHALARALTDPAPERRPTAREIARSLGAPGLTPPRAAPFVRVEELARLDAHCRAHRAEPALVVVEGASGAGKTTLLGELERRLGSDAHWLAGRCSHREAVPYRAVDPLLDALSALWLRLSPRPATALVPAGARALCELFPVLARVPPLARAAASDMTIADPRERRRVAVCALREVLRGLAADRPTVLCIDDAQWVDEDGAQLLSEVVRAPDAPPVLVLLAMRPWDEPAEREGVTALADTVGALERLSLAPLDAAQSLALARSLAPDRPASWARTVELGAGLPFLLGQLSALASAGAQLEGPLDLDGSLRARLGALGPLCRRALDVVALAGEPVSAELVGEALGEPPELLRPALSWLESQRYLRHTAGARPGLVTDHDRVTEFVRGALSEDERRTCHALLADALEARDPVGHARALFFHCRAAGQAARAVTHGRTAGERAKAQLAFLDAAQFFGACAELTRDGAEQRWLLARQAEVLASAGRNRDSAQVLERLAALTEAQTECDDLLRRAAEQRLLAGDVETGLAELAPVLERAGLRLPRSSAGLLLELAWLRLRVWWRGLDFAAREPGEIAPAALARIDAALTLAVQLGSQRVLWGALFGARALLDALSAGERTRIARALLVEAVVRSVGPTAAAAQRALRLAGEIAHGAPGMVGQVHFAAAQCALARFDHGALVGHVGRALEAFAQQDEVPVADLAALRWMNTALRHQAGDTLELGRAIGEGLRDAEERHDARLVAAYRDLSATLALARGYLAQARAGLAESLAALEGNFLDMRRFGHLLLACQLDLAEGAPDAARTRLEGALPALRRGGFFFAAVTRIWCRYTLGLALAGARDARARRALGTLVCSLAREPSAEGRALGRQLGLALRVVEGDRQGVLREAEALARELEGLGLAWYARGTRAFALLGARDRAGLGALEAELCARGVGEPRALLRIFAPLAALEGAP